MSILLATSTNSFSELRQDFLDRKRVLKSLEANSSISPQNVVIRPHYQAKKHTPSEANFTKNHIHHPTNFTARVLKVEKMVHTRHIPGPKNRKSRVRTLQCCKFGGCPSSGLVDLVHILGCIFIVRRPVKLKNSARQISVKLTLTPLLKLSIQWEHSGQDLLQQLLQRRARSLKNHKKSQNFPKLGRWLCRSGISCL